MTRNIFCIFLFFMALPIKAHFPEGQEYRGVPYLAKRPDIKAISLDNLKAVNLRSINVSQVEFKVSRDLQGPFINQKTDKLTICSIEIIEANLSLEAHTNLGRTLLDDHHSGFDPAEGTGSFPLRFEMKDTDEWGDILKYSYRLNNYERLPASYFIVTAPKNFQSISDWLSNKLNPNGTILIQAKACGNI